MIVVALAVIIYVLVILAWWRIFHRVGWSPWLSVLFLVPVANLVMLFIFAVTRWPIERETETSLTDAVQSRRTGSSTRYCPSCGSECGPDARYCSSCGSAL